MKTVCYKTTGDELTPVIATVNGNETPIWIQQRINGVDNAGSLKGSGCGHCSVTMILNLKGIKITPWGEFQRCIDLFGEPSVSNNGNKQYAFLSVTGMVKVLKTFGLKAESFGVLNGDRKKATEHIIKELKKGKLVAFVSAPSEDFLNNPFSKGHHWVVACGFDGDGKIVVLNSSLNGNYDGSVLGINLVDETTIEKALSKVASPTDKTWGEMENLDVEGCGYVVVD